METQYTPGSLNTKLSNPRYETRGLITRAYISGNRLHIEGKAASLTGHPIDAFRVLFGDMEFYVQHSPLEGTTQQVFALEMSLDGVSSRVLTHLEKSLSVSHTPFQHFQRSARKSLAYLLPKLFEKMYGKAIRSQKPLLTVIPLMSGKEGYEIHGLFNVLAPLPFAKEVVKIGGGNVLEVSASFLSIMAGYGGLKKTDRFLDVGCGLGRMAYALTYYLESSAKYEGFDIMPSPILRAQKFISPYFPHFRFRHVDLWNSYYNPSCETKSSSLIFPYEDNSFDFTLLTSVFTHMLTADVKHYLSEIHRVLAPGGTCLFTCFLMTDESKQLIQSGKSTQQLIHPIENHCFAAFADTPEAAIGYEKTKMLELIEQTGFKLQKVCDGSWCGRKENYLSYQDVVIISKQ